MAKWIFNSGKKLNAEQVGQKAANLSYLIQHGYPVPKTAFISVGALSKSLQNNRLEAPIKELLQKESAALVPPETLKDVRQKIEQLVLPEDLQDELAALLKQWRADGVQHLAVRSSAVSEDLGAQSFAGQYFSALQVDADLEAVSQAVRQVWASLFSDRVWSYCRQHDVPLPAQAMGVIIQEMVPARFAGVAFSQNPLQPEKEEVFIEYAVGSGQQLVDGEVVPGQLHLSKEKIHTGTLKFGDVQRELGGLQEFVNRLLRLEEQTGSAVDVEWAFDGTTYYFLQFRPITTLGIGIVWSDENVGEVIPDVVTPFSWSILQPMTNGAYRYFLRNLGLRMPKQPLFTLYEGKVYFNQNAFRQVMEAFYLTTYLGPEKRISFKKLFKLLKLNYLLLRLGYFLLRLPYKIWPWNRVIPDQLIYSNENLTPQRHIREIKRLLGYARKAMNLHISVTIFAEIFYQALDKVCAAWCADEGIEASRLLQGIGDVESTQPARALWEIGQWIRNNETYRERFTKMSVDELQQWLANQPRRDPLRKAIDLFFEHYGHGALHEFELIYPRWREDSGYILQSLRNYARYQRNGFNLQEHLRTLEQERQALKEKALNHLQKYSWLRRKLFKYLLKKAEYFSFEREILKQQIVRIFAGLKAHLNALSNHYFDDGQAIFYLTWPEVQALVKGQLKGKELTLKIQQRRLLRNRQMEMVHPSRLKQIGDRWLPLTETGAAEGALTGIPCSPGVVEGKVQVILQADEGTQFERGDILVTRATNPGWTPLMVLAGGIITEIGGALSHGAIIAREFGIPMIAAVPEVTSRLKSGQWVRMNGQTGTIELLEED